ncbi:hypothetical protein [Bifidobacterium oedipodis]|uniref:Lipoprotein n=1 Tax=Bifidobacterium oedipodis TaxID=2675322 RepID=A0A7Y0ENW1_9BIFI|nr:hypothetical protein [Bifidobacterium sp. DSM 109957]NMM93758.1 hypothetical protein [Bifidobacterium sp. DSM 109957]
MTASPRKIIKHSVATSTTAFLSCVSLLVCLTACTTPSDKTTTDSVDSQARIAPSMNALFDQYLAKDTLSQFEREVLQRARDNGKISAEDYETAHDKQMSCMSQNGWEEQTRKLSNGLYQTTGVSPTPSTDAEVNDYMEASDTCSTGTSKIIESLYQLQQGNPGLLADPYETAVECLKKNDLVDESFTGRKLENALGGDDAAKNLPFDISSDTAQSCIAGAGLAANIG